MVRGKYVFGLREQGQRNLLHRIASMEAEDRIFEVVVPTEVVEEVKHGERRRVEKKMFQGYVLVEWT